MAVFKVKAKNRVDIDKKPRVYFTCHPDDFEKYFKKVCDDIFKTHDCAIYYTEDMTASIADDEKEIDIGRNNLLVVPVTYKLLTTSNRAMDEDVPYALKEHIPVLPIMMEPGIDEFYSKPDKFSELQYLNPYSTDLTEISYEEKMKKYLESVLVGDELAKRIREAFSAHVFLSYRKIDRKYANELLKRIHSYPKYRDVAIWFDEFLTPGESFKDNIQKMLDECQLFTLLVTPRLWEKSMDLKGKLQDNYVISTELPLARQKKAKKEIDILAVVMEKVDSTALKKLDVGEGVAPGDSSFSRRLHEAIPMPARASRDTPEQDFLMGLAYLNGIDVELDSDRAIALLEDAAQRSYVEAAAKLVDIYRNGICVPKSADKAVRWQTWVIKLFTQCCKTTPSPENLDNLLWAYIELGDLYKEADCIAEAKQAYETALALGQNGPMLPDAVAAYTRLGDLYRTKLYDTEKAMALYEKALQMQADFPKWEDDPVLCRRFAICHQMLSDAYRAKKDFPNAKEHLKKAIALLHPLKDSAYRIKVIRDIACCYERLGWIYRECGEHQEYIDCCEECLQLRLQLNDINETDESLRDLCVSYMQLGLLYRENLNEKKAEECYLFASDVAQKRYDLYPSTDAVQMQASIGDGLSKVYLEDGRFDIAWDSAKKAEALCMQEEQAVETVEVLRCLSNIYETLAISAAALGRDAEHYYQQTLQLRRRVADATAAATDQNDLSVAIENLGGFYANQERYQDAMDCYRQTLQLRLEEVQRARTYQAMRYLAITYDHIGEICFTQGDLKAAIEHFQEALDLRLEILENEETDECLYELSVSFKRIGDVFAVLENHSVAFSCYENMREVCQVVVQRTGSNRALRNLMIAYSSCGNVLLEQNRLTEAGEQYHEAFMLCSELDKACPTLTTKTDIIQTLRRIAGLFLVQDNHQSAAFAYKMVLHYNVQRLELVDTPRNWELFGNNLLEAAEAVVEDRASRIETAIDIFQKLLTEHPQNKNYQQKLDYACALKEII